MTLVTKANYLHTTATPAGFNNAVAKLSISRDLAEYVASVRGNSSVIGGNGVFRQDPSKHLFRALLYTQKGEVIELLPSGAHVLDKGTHKDALSNVNRVKYNDTIYLRINKQDTLAEQALDAISDGTILVRRPRVYDYVPGDARTALEGLIVEEPAVDKLLSDLGITGPIEAKTQQSQPKKRESAPSEPEDFREAKIAPHRRKSLSIMQPEEYLATILRD